MAKRTAKPATRTSKQKSRAETTSPRPARPTAIRARKAPAKPGAATVYQLKITLDVVRPPVWRRVLVKDCTLAELHDIIQISMGWEDDHLHLFEIDGEPYGDPEQWEDPDVGNEGKVKLSQLVERGVKKLPYVYDMGDTWRHPALVEKTLPAEPGVRYPRCTGGKRACPPEDCGGPWGYADFVESLRDPNHPRHDDRLDWIGDEFNPEEFDPEAVNGELAAVL